MGGFVVQQYLQSHRAQAAVLMASMPTHAARRAAVALRIMRRHPLVTLRAYTVGGAADLVNTPRLAREHFFCTHTPESVVHACAQRLQAESSGAGGLFVRSKPTRVTTPLLVLGGEDDGALTPSDVQATARAYGTEAEFFPHMGHNMMLEAGWPNVAGRIQSWLNSQGI
jgi:alpha-beta hydrolase superfamily lysophospholipase